MKDSKKSLFIHSLSGNARRNSAMSTFLGGCFSPQEGITLRQSLSLRQTPSSTATAVAPSSPPTEPAMDSSVELPAMHRLTSMQDPTAETTPIDSIPDDLLRECLARLSRKAIGPASGVCRKWREIIHSTEYRETRFGLGQAENRLLVLSANAKSDNDSHPVRVQMFRPRSRNWTCCVLQDRGISIDDFSSCCAMEQKVFIFGGVIGNCRSDPPVLYNLWTNEVKRMQHMGCPRTKFVSGVIDGRLYVAGGLRNQQDGPAVGSSSGGVSAAELASPLAGTPTAGVPGEPPSDAAVPSPETPGSAGSRGRFGAGRLSRKKQGPPPRVEPRDLKSAEVYDPESDTWHFLPEMAHARVGCVGGAVGGKLYVLGGTSKIHVPLLQVSQERPNHSLEIYDPGSDTWTIKEPIPRTGYILGSVILGRSIFLMRSDNGRISWLKYDTDADTWTPLHDVPIPPDHRLTHLVKFDCTAAGDRIYVVQVWGSQEDLGHRPRGRSVSGALVLQYTPAKEGPAAWTRVADMPVVARGAVCTGVVC